MIDLRMDRRRVLTSFGLIGFSGCLRIQEESEDIREDAGAGGDDRPSEEDDDRAADDSSDGNADEQALELSRAWDPPINPRMRSGDLIVGLSHHPERHLELVSSGGSAEWESDPLDEAYGFRNDGGDRIAISESYVCYGSRKHEELDHAKLYCFSRDTGELLWTHRTEDGPRDIRIDYVTLGDGRVYYATGTDAGSSDEQDPFVRALDAASGELAWETSYQIAAYRGLLYHEGDLYARGNRLRILNPETGSERASHRFGTGIGGFVEFDDTLYGISGDVYAFDLSSNEPEYTHPVDRRPDSRIAVTDRYLYAGDDNGWLDAYDRRTGEREWETRLTSRVRDRPAVVADHVWVVDNEDIVYGLDTETGDVVYESQEERTCCPVGIDDVLLLMVEGRPRAYRVESR